MDSCRIDVHLVSGSRGWELDQWNFQPTLSSPALHSIRGDRYRRINRSIAWTLAMKAIVLLLLRHAASGPEWATLHGGRGSPARTLANLLEHPDRSSAGAAFTDRQGHCHLKRMIECNTVGRDPGGGVRHTVGFKCDQISPAQVRLHIDGLPCVREAKIKSVAEDIRRAWPTHRKPSPTLAANDSLTRRTGPSDWNDAVARFYRQAGSAGWLQAASETMGELIPGALQLAFTTSAGPDLHYAHSGGSDGDSFLLETMSTASSHPLIYNCEGKVRCISDVLSAKDWRARAMYRAARPHLKMADAMGSDWRLSDGRMLNVCTIREKRSFTERDRQALTWLAPHLCTAAAMHLGPPPPRNRSAPGHLRILPLDSLSVGAARFEQELSLNLQQVTRTSMAIDSDLCGRIKQWWSRHHANTRRHSRPTRIKSNCGLTVLCVPPGTSTDGAILASQMPRQSGYTKKSEAERS